MRTRCRYLFVNFTILSLLALGTGCAGSPTGGMLFSNYTLPVWPGHATGPMLSADYAGVDYEEVGKVEGRSSMVTVLGLIMVGDAGGGTAYENALANGGADAVINAQMDYEGFGVLGLFARITVTLEGIGIKFKD